MPSLWRFVPGSGWVLQPVPASPNPVPASQGCVITPETAQGFGFHRTLRWVRKIVITTVLVLITAALVWMWHAGHEVEVAGELLAAGLIVATAAVYEDLKRFFRKRFFGPGGESAWR
ncbi:hypothetical protein [Streptomyces fungicidicus]|uniref:hypothetical protein n=1 Tax=Streptomyces fungicidicus TaxID=68203 RepID=UPI0037F26848